jgi:hypothetical protein
MDPESYSRSLSSEGRSAVADAIVPTGAGVLLRFDGPPPVITVDSATSRRAWRCFCGETWAQPADRAAEPMDAENTAWIHRMVHIRVDPGRSHPCQGSPALVSQPCTACGMDAWADRHTSDHGVDLRQIVPGVLVRFEGEDDDDLVTARVVRLDTPTFGVVEAQPRHGQGDSYRTLFSALNVYAILPEAVQR